MTCVSGFNSNVLIQFYNVEYNNCKHLIISVFYSLFCNFNTHSRKELNIKQQLYLLSNSCPWCQTAGCTGCQTSVLGVRQQSVLGVKLLYWVLNSKHSCTGCVSCIWLVRRQVFAGLLHINLINKLVICLWFIWCSA